MLELLHRKRVFDAAEWVQDNIYLNAEVSPNKPGKLNLTRQPWMKEILQAFLDPSITELYMCMGAQTR